MIRFFLCGSHYDSPCIVNAQSEQEAYKIVTGNEWPVDGPDEEQHLRYCKMRVNWECTEITLKPGETLDLSRFV
jgi:hypothetical protein